MHTATTPFTASHTMHTNSPLTLGPITHNQELMRTAPEAVKATIRQRGLARVLVWKEIIEPAHPDASGVDVADLEGRDDAGVVLPEIGSTQRVLEGGMDTQCARGRDGARVQRVAEESSEVV